jgi:hypothetical protein
LEDRVAPAAYTVNDLGDAATGTGNSGTLRYVIHQANNSTDASNTITITVNGTTTLGSALEPLTSKITSITGPGASNYTVQRDTSRGNFTIFNINADTAITISGLTVTKGNGYGNGGFGGGIYNLGDLTLTACVITQNTARSAGGGIYNHGTLTLDGTTVSKNQAPDTSLGQGGGIENDGGQLIIKNQSYVTLNTSAIDGGGIYNSLGTVTISNSEISGNNATGKGGGIYNQSTTDSIALNIRKSSIWNNNALGANGFGGGVYNNGSASLSNTTVAGNTAAKGGGIYAAKIGIARFYTKTTNVTDANNKAVVVTPPSAPRSSSTTPSGPSGGLGGGLYVENGAEVDIVNTIIATNTADLMSPDVFVEAGWAVTSLGYNLIGDGTGSSGWIQSGPGADMVGTSSNPINPLLNPLGNYGGPTVTMTLQSGSPALRAGNVAAVDDTTDQRGLPRIYTDPNTGQQYVDIGAVEMQPGEVSGFSSTKRK